MVEMIEELKNIPLFRNLPTEILSQLAAVIKQENYPDSAVIFEENSVGDCLYILTAGEILIQKRISEKTGKYKILSTLQRGDFFGEMALLESVPRSAAAVAKGEVSVLRLNREDFQNIISGDPEVARKCFLAICQNLGKRLRVTSQELATTYEVGKVINSADNLPKLTETTLQTLMRVIPGIKTGLLSLWNEFNREFDLVAWKGFKTKGEAESFLKQNSELPKWLITEKEPLLIKDLINPPGLPSPRGGKGSVLGAPLLSRSKVLGFILLANRSKINVFTAEERNLLGGIASQIAGAVESFQHRQEQLARQRLKRVYPGRG